MKKLVYLFVFISLVFCGNKTYAQKDDDKGFAMSLDLLEGYKDKCFSTSVGYDFGYRFIPGLYVGAGPMAAFSYGQGQSAFLVGGYTKVRYIVPIKFTIKPFADVRVGYSYNFKMEKGGMDYGFGLGATLTKNIRLGFYCNIGRRSEIETYKYTKTHKSPYTGKIYTTTHTGTRTVEKPNFVPSLLFSVDF